MKRTQKIHLLTALITGTATSKQITDLRQSMEPIHLTFIIGEEDDPFEQDPNEPTYHIEVFADGTTKCYDRYSDGRTEYRSS